MLLDAHGRPLESLPTKPITDPIAAVRVRDQWSSYPSNGLTPVKLAAILREADAGEVTRQYELAEETEEKDLDLSGVLHTRKLAVQQLPWEIVPASEGAQDKKIVEFVTEVLEDLDLDEPVLHLLDAIYKGIAATEIHWDVQGREVWPVGLERIPQQRFTFNQVSSNFDAPVPKLPNLLTTAQPVNGEEIPPFKVLFHRYAARSGFPQKLGLFRGCAWLYLFKNFDIKDWVVFLEKYGHPLRLGKYMQGADKDAIATLKSAVRDLGSDSAAVISDQTMIELLEAKLSGSHDGFERFARYVNERYQIGILGQSGTTQGTPGKLGNENEQGEVRRDLLKADARALSKTIRAQLIWPIVGFNFGWDIELPQFVFHCEDPEDLVQLASVHKTLVEIGTPIPLSFIQKKYGIPEPVGDEPVLQGSQKAGKPEGQTPQASQPPSFQAFQQSQAKKKVPIGSRLVSFGE